MRHACSFGNCRRNASGGGNIRRSKAATGTSRSTPSAATSGRLQYLKSRDECLSDNRFLSLADAREIIEAWSKAYNSTRPHSSLGGLDPTGVCRDYARTPVGTRIMGRVSSWHLCRIDRKEYHACTMLRQSSDSADIGLTTRPFWTMVRTLRMASMSCSGSPSTPITSAIRPAVIAPS